MAAMRVVAAPDKFKGTASASEVAAAIARAATELGWDCDQVPMADGGEGTLAAFGGANRTAKVTGPLGDPVEAGWRLDQRSAVIEMAEASGLQLVGGPDDNDPIAATTYGTGELIALAAEAGAESILVGVGGSASTDGGLGALRALGTPHKLRGLDLIVACDVRTRFVDAAATFAPQKGATPAQVELLTRRLERLVEVYRGDYGVDVSNLEGGGAAGGLAGGLAAISAVLVPGVEAVGEAVGLEATMEGADLVVTGEGFLDEESFDGKVVGGVAQMAGRLGLPVFAVVGQCYDDVEDRLETVTLVERFGADRAIDDTVACITEVVRAFLQESAG